MILSHSAALREHRPEPLERGNQIPLDRPCHGHVNGRGKHVVSALPHVDVIVGMDGLVGLKAVAAGKFDRPVRDHFVGIHVARRARAGLKDVDRKLGVELPLGHFAARLPERLHLLGREWAAPRAGQLPQLAVSRGRGQLHQPQGVNQRGGQSPTGDRKILDGPLRLGAVISLGRDAHVPHRITLNANFRHAHSLVGRSLVTRPVTKLWWVASVRPAIDVEVKSPGHRHRQLLSTSFRQRGGANCPPGP